MSGMARDDHFGLDHPLWNQLLEENNSIISYEDRHLFQSRSPSLSFCNPVSQLSYQNAAAQYIPASINITVHSSNPTISETSYDNDNSSSLITSLNSSAYGSPTVNQGSVSPTHVMMFKNPRLDAMQETQMAIWHASQLKCYNDRVIAASRMLQEQRQMPHQLENVSKPNKVVMNAGLALRRLNAYLYYRRQRPPDNDISYWRSFVKHFYSPNVRKKTCFSKYDHGASHSHGVFSLLDAWKCEICESTSGKGFVETYDALPRLNQLYFKDGGVVDELLYFEVSKEKTLPDGSLLVCFDKAVQECIYTHSRVIHEGKLRVVLTPQLKIISWDFCVQDHEVVLPRRLIVAQVNDLMKGATSYRNNANANANVNATCPSRVREHCSSSSSNSDRLAAAARNLATTVEQSHLTDLGLPKHFVRSLQVSEHLNSMKDLMTSCLNNNTSPIEALKQYGQRFTTSKLEPVKSSSSSRSSAQNARRPSGPGPGPGPHPSPYQIPSDSDQFMLNELLAHIQRDGSHGTKQGRSENPRQQQQRKQKRKVEDDQVSSKGLELMGRPVNKSGRKDSSNNNNNNGKGLNSSCSSNSSRLFPDCNFLKREPDLDEDFTSPAQTQRNHHPW